MAGERKSINPAVLYPAIAVLLYFSQGFPFGIVNILFGTYLRAENVSLDKIGYINAVGIAWTLKFLWAPAVDLVGTYRRWIAASLIAIASALAAIGIFGASNWTAFVVASTTLAFASATQDIAIDATTIRITPRTLLGPVNSVRVAAYRIAMMAAGGGLAIVGSTAGWPAAFFIAAGIAILLLVSLVAIPHVERAEVAVRENPFKGLLHWLRRPRAYLLLVIVLLYKLGDSSLNPMIGPYWIDRGFTAAEVGTVTTVVGVWFVVAGAFVGGAVVSRMGMYRSLILLGVLQILSNVAYAVVAATDAPRAALYPTAMIESFTYGLGTAAFLAFLMSICDREHAATEYAMLSAVFALSRTLVSTISGVGAESLGYAGYFWLTVFLGIPALFIVPWVRDYLRDTEAPKVAEVLEG